MSASGPPSGSAGSVAESAVAGDGPSEELKRLARALSGVKQRLHNPKLPNDACYAGVGYELPDPPMLAAKRLHEPLGPLLPGMSLDRINPNGPYALSNLRFATAKEQTANRRPLKKHALEDEEDWFDDA
jgi:hypothetical protein